MKRVAVILFLIAAMAIGGLAWLQHHYAPAGMALEAAKALLSLLAVAVISPIVAFLVAHYNETKAKQSEADKIRHHTLDVLNESYVAAKKIRRRTRARLELPTLEPAHESGCISKQLYFQSLERLNDVQLRLEVLAKDIESHAGLFPDGQTIFKLISSMEEYLNTLVDEWEHGNPPFTGSPAKTSIYEIPCFHDFIGDYRNSRFRPEFVHSYYKAIEAIRRSLITVKGATWKERRKSVVNGNKETESGTD